MLFKVGTLSYNWSTIGLARAREEEEEEEEEISMLNISEGYSSRTKCTK